MLGYHTPCSYCLVLVTYFVGAGKVWDGIGWDDVGCGEEVEECATTGVWHVDRDGELSIIDKKPGRGPL